MQKRYNSRSKIKLHFIKKIMMKSKFGYENDADVFYVKSSSDRNDAIYTPNKNLRKRHKEMIWIYVIDMIYYHINRMKIMFRKNNLLFQILQCEWR